MAVVKVQTKGQMTVPQTLRDALGIGAGTQLVCTQTGPDAFECRVLPKMVGLRAFVDSHSGPEPAPSPQEVIEIVREGMLAEARAQYGDALED